jgi:hypothetical protein
MIINLSYNGVIVASKEVQFDLKDKSISNWTVHAYKEYFKLDINNYPINNFIITGKDLTIKLLEKDYIETIREFKLNQLGI